MEFLRCAYNPATGRGECLFVRNHPADNDQQYFLDIQDRLSVSFNPCKSSFLSINSAITNQDQINFKKMYYI
jgi:hypothetical protein